MGDGQARLPACIIESPLAGFERSTLLARRSTSLPFLNRHVMLFRRPDEL